MTLVLALLLVNISVYAGHETQRYEYQQEQLANGLKLAVLSNTKLKRNHIAIRVAAGSLHEPLGFPGLAHLLEHLVFQYQLPKSSSSLRQWIQANGGQQNAHTNLEDTLYFFDVPPHDAALALNHWNHALQQLDYTPGAVKNELTTLTQEFALRARNRHWLHWDALKALSPATHPFKRLHPGNETSLARFGQKELRLALKSFQAKYYQTNRITLAISGPQSVEALLTLGRTAFSPKLREPPPTTQTHLGQFIDQHHLPATLKIKSDHRQVISLLFSLGDKAHTSDQQVFSYLQYLIQNPGKHSLLDTLRRQGLVTDLSSGIGINTKEQNTFHITFQTTDTGWKNPDRITTSVFRYIKLIQQQGLAEWRIKEFENLVRLRHLKAFNDWTPMDITLKMAECFSDLDSLLDATQLRHSLSVGFSADFRKISKALQPQNLISIHMDSNYSGKFLSPVFATSFDIFKNTNDDFLETLSNKTWPKKTVAVISPLQLPDAEPLVPQQWKLPFAANATAVPELILRDSQLEIWHGFDSEWNSPLAQVKLLFKQPIASLTIDKAVMTEILLLDAKTKLHHYRERLENLGYSFQLIRTSEGLMINIEGFTETLSEVMTPIVNALQNPYIEKQYVAALGEQLKNHWRTEARYGFEELFDHLHAKLLPRQWSKDNMISALANIELDQLQAHSHQLLPAGNITALFYGRINPNEVLASVEMLRPFSDKTTQYSAPPLYASLQAGARDHLNIATRNPDNALVYYHQAFDSTAITTGKIQLLRHLLHPRFFESMRTDKKLGYAVFVAQLPLYDRAGFALTIQSPTTSAATIHQATAQFLLEFDSYLTNLDKESFDQAKLALQQGLSWKTKAPQQRVELFWKHIRSGSLQSAILLEQGQLISELTLPELQHYFRDHVIGENGRGIVLTSGNNRDKITPAQSPLL